jgi:predicted ABC-type transport system involved in lysophospholipase L1 biosynthesis ATPase subunit
MELALADVPLCDIKRKTVRSSIEEFFCANREKKSVLIGANDDIQLAETCS